MIIYEGKSHRTRAELEARRRSEINIGDQKFIPPDFILADPVALAKWNDLMKIYHCPAAEGIVTSADTDILASYCETFSEEQTLIGLRQKAKTDKGKLKYTIALLKTREMRLKISNHIYLNPIARIKNIPKKIKPDENNPLKKAGFGNV